MIYYLITAGVVALGLLATWTSGRDVGYRNAMRTRNSCTKTSWCSAPEKAAVNDGGGTRGPD